MPTVFRAHSPSRGTGGTAFSDRDAAVRVASVRNQYTTTDTALPADWEVQTGHVQWETPSDLARIRAVLDQLADDTAPGETTYAGTYGAYESAIDTISRIAYPEEDHT